MKRVGSSVPRAGETGSETYHYNTEAEVSVGRECDPPSISASHPQALQPRILHPSASVQKGSL